MRNQIISRIAGVLAGFFGVSIDWELPIPGGRPEASVPASSMQLTHSIASHTQTTYNQIIRRIAGVLAQCH